MNTEYQEEEFEESDERSDYIDGPSGTDLGTWDENTDPGTIDDWASDDEKQAAQEFYDENHVEPWSGATEPKEEQFETYEEFQDAKTDFKVDKALRQSSQNQVANQAQAAAEIAAAEHPAETDKNFDRKSELIEKVHEYAAKADEAERAGDFKKAKDFEGHMRIYASELKDLAKPQQDAETADQRKRVTADRTGHLDHWISNPEEWEKQVAELGADRMAEDAEVYAIQQAKNSDDNTLYLVIGHSKTGNDGKPRLLKIDVPAQVKTEILSRLSWDDVTLYDAAKTHPAIQDQIPDAAEAPDGIDLSDDDQLKALTAPEAEKLSQADFERWRILSGAKQPVYHPIIPPRKMA